MSKSSRREIHENYSQNKDFIAMTMPLLAMGVFLYGPRVLLLALVAVITAKLSDRFAALLLGRSYNPTENLSVGVALVIVLMVPATVRFRVIVMAVLVAVLVAKEAFGGPGNYPFNPAAVGYCVAVVSFSDEMFMYPQPLDWFNIADWSFGGLMETFSLQNATMVHGLSYALRNNGLPGIDTWDMLLGNYAGPIGTTATIVILACGVYLWVKKHLPISAPLAYLGTVAGLTFFFPRAPYGAWEVMPWFNWAARLQSMQAELLSGAIMFTAIFLVMETCTLPKHKLSRVIYGMILGVGVTVFRYFGTYELGTCFAFLIINAISGYFDRAIAARVARKGATA